MPKAKLTDAAVDKFKAPPGARIEYFDATLPGFGIRVAGPTDNTPEGRKSWVLFYRYRGKQKRLTFADPYPALSLKDARRKAGDALDLLRGGIDPATHFAEAKAEAERPRETFGTAAEAFLAKGLRGRGGKPLAAGYVESVRRNLDNHVLPRWRDRELVTITRKDVVALLDAIAACEAPPAPAKRDRKKKAYIRATGGPVAANRVLAVIRSLFNWAVSRSLIEINPCAAVKPPGQETRRERVLSTPEIIELWAAFLALGDPFGPFLQIVFLTGQRRSECAGIRWDSLDLDADTWTLTADETKAGRSHVVPLSPQAVAILKALPRKTMTLPDKKTRPSPYVFTSTGQAPISGFSAAKEAAEAKVAEARREVGIAETMAAWNINDLRRTCATEMGRLGIPEFIIAKVLNHTSKGITGQVYNRYEYLSEKRLALEAWGTYLAGLMQPRVACDTASVGQAA